MADEATTLDAGDLELLAISACLIGRNDDSIRTLDRAYHRYLDAGEPSCAALLHAERLAPQRIHKDLLVRETGAGLLRQARRDAGGRELRGLA